ncbi:MAG: glycosyltransferase [Bacteroidetes bacterium]|nr:glycosyltransferase [Bacteroidota bacterium]
MTAPYLTIIIPTYQAEKTLQASLDSVLSQDFRDLEILVMDGGSKDRTIEIVQAAAAEDPRIRLVSERDKGVYDAMNKGVRQARGTWLFFLGSDDFLFEPTTLSTVFPGYEDADFIYGNVVGDSYKGAYDGQFDYAKLLSRNISHQAIFYRRTLFDRFEAYDLRYKGYADWELNIRLFRDESVRRRYIGGIIARFGPFGLSSRHDVPFLQQVLFPARLELLRETGLSALYPVGVYDEWWRLIRNAEFPVRPSGGLPKVIDQMFAWQQKLPRRMLKIGVCSKLIMFASYLRHHLSGALK